MFIKLSSECNQEMTKDGVIGFVNSYTHRRIRSRERLYIIWKIINHPEWRNNYIVSKIVPVRAQVGNGWFQGFVNRWSDEIGYSTQILSLKAPRIAIVCPKEPKRKRKKTREILTISRRILLIEMMIPVSRV